MSKFYPASKQSNNPLKTLINDEIPSIRYQASGIRFPISTELYGSLSHPRILLNGSGIPENVVLNFPENETSGVYPKISGNPVFGLTYESIQINNGGSGNNIGDEYFIYSDAEIEIGEELPAYITVSETGINGSVTNYIINNGGYRFRNNSLLSAQLPEYSLAANKIPPQISLIPDKFAIVDIDISTYGSGYAISKNFINPCTYITTTSNPEHNFLAISTVSREINLDFDYLSLIKDEKRKDVVVTSDSIKRSNNFDYNYKNKLRLKSNGLTLHNQELNNPINYSYTSAGCEDDQDCGFCENGVLISSGGCETFEDIFPSGSIVRLCTEYDTEEGGNSACEAFQLIYEGSDCTDCYTDGIQVAYVECIKICCPDGSTGVFPTGDARAGRCCEDCSETSLEEGQPGSPVSEGNCVDGQCSGENNPDPSGACVEDIYIPESLCWEFPESGFTEEIPIDFAGGLIAGGLLTPLQLSEWIQELKHRAALANSYAKKYAGKINPLTNELFTEAEIRQIATNDIIKRRPNVFNKNNRTVNNIDINNMMHVLKNDPNFIRRMGLEGLELNSDRVKKIFKEFHQQVLKRIEEIRKTGDDLNRYKARDEKLERLRKALREKFTDPKTKKIDWQKWFKYQKELAGKAKCASSAAIFKGKGLGCAIGIAIALGGSQVLGDELSDILNSIPPVTPADLAAELIMEIIFDKLTRDDEGNESIVNDIYSSYIDGQMTLGQLKDTILQLTNDGNSVLLRELFNKFNIDIASLTFPTNPLDLLNSRTFLERIKENIDDIQIKIIQERIKQLENISNINNQETAIIDSTIEDHINNFYSL
jgi:hypothetical protein